MNDAPRRLLPLPDDWSRALAIVAHPDDLEYGAASAIATWTDAGRHVGYVLASRGEAGIDALEPAQCARVREAEERASAATVGVGDVQFLDHADGVIEYGIALRRDLARTIRVARPELLVTINYHATWGGRSLNMADHRNVGLAVIDAARDAGNRWVFPESGLEPWGGVRYIAVNAAPSPTHAVDVGEHLERGIASLECHVAYLAHVGVDARAMLTERARADGAAFGCEYAVSFELLEL
ncbi:MAG TPA: PIG-L deacetylase family protein [Acidimicrobiia bacterium]